MKRSNVSVFVPHMGCPFRCSFCDQNSITGQQSAPTPDDVVRACETAVSSGCSPESEVAFFGGSFTAVDREYARQLLLAARPFVEAGRFSGIRISTRPDFINREILSFLKGNRVTAIELGAQSMDDSVLLKNRRGHTAESVREASRLILEYGFELGLQMMTGLYGDTDEGAEYTAGQLAALSPKTVRIYPAVVLKNTYLGDLYTSGKYSPQTLDEAVGLCSRLLGFFEKKGIRVIRLGLHASPDVERDMLAGPYHPSFRELCESAVFFERLSAELYGLGRGEYIISVNPRDLSKATGNRRSNLIKLDSLGYGCTLEPCDGIGRNDFTIRRRDV